MEKYEPLTCEVIVFDTEDVLTTSGKPGDTSGFPVGNNFGGLKLDPDNFGG